jgi:phage terminase Nu1 subunit (DNA packaging protein)
MRITSQDSIASLFGVSRETINTWQDQGFPVALRGGPNVPSEYDSADCIRWRIARELDKAGAESPTNRLARAKAEAQEMANLEKRGTLVPVALIEPKLKASVVAARERLLDAVPRVARDLPPELDAREAMLQAEFEAFLHWVADWRNSGDIEDEGG